MTEKQKDFHTGITDCIFDMIKHLLKTEGLGITVKGKDGWISHEIWNERYEFELEFHDDCFEIVATEKE